MNNKNNKLVNGYGWNCSHRSVVLAKGPLINNKHVLAI